jgi:hypothetical protein
MLLQIRAVDITAAGKPPNRTSPRLRQSSYSGKGLSHRKTGQKWTIFRAWENPADS